MIYLLFCYVCRMFVGCRVPPNKPKYCSLCEEKPTDPCSTTKRISMWRDDNGINLISPTEKNVDAEFVECGECKTHGVEIKDN